MVLALRRASGTRLRGSAAGHVLVAGKETRGRGEAAGGEAADGSCRGFEGTVGLGASAERTHVIVRADLAAYRRGGQELSSTQPAWTVDEPRPLLFTQGGEAVKGLKMSKSIIPVESPVPST